MNAKTLFLRQTELAAYWVGIARSESFQHVLLYARSEFIHGKPSAEEMAGAEKMLETLSTLADNEEGPVDFPSPGLHHFLDSLTDKPQQS